MSTEFNTDVKEEVTADASLAATRSAYVGTYRLLTPMIWLGHDLKNPYHVWETLPDCPGVLVNASQIADRKWFRKLASASGIHDALHFRGPVFLDSGGFQLQNGGRKNLTIEFVLETQRAVRPDLAAVLDFPLSPRASDDANRRRWSKTVQATELMNTAGTGIQLAPVIHTYSPTAVATRAHQIRQILPASDFWCIGSLVPLLRGSYLGGRFAGHHQPTCVARWQLIVRLILAMRAAVGESIVHAFGAGSLSTAALLFMAGVDSVDSAAWRIKAAHGAIQLPGLADRFMSPRDSHTRVRKLLTAKCCDLLSACTCPVCSDASLELRIERLRDGFRSRATHNAFVMISEVSRIREAARQGQLQRAVLDLLRPTPLFYELATLIASKTNYSDIKIAP